MREIDVKYKLTNFDAIRRIIACIMLVNDERFPVCFQKFQHQL